VVSQRARMSLEGSADPYRLMAIMRHARSWKKASLSETDDFLGSVMPRLTEADTALHNGDATQYGHLVTQRSGDRVRGGAVGKRMG
jgi:hypothetical protein